VGEVEVTPLSVLFSLSTLQERAGEMIGNVGDGCHSWEEKVTVVVARLMKKWQHVPSSGIKEKKGWIIE